MSNVINSFPKANNTPGLGGGVVPPNRMHQKRFPFVFLIDVSGSTSRVVGGSERDIDFINRALATLLDNIRNPPHSSELYQTKDLIDVAIIAYSDSPTEVLGWTTAPNLPAALPQLNPLNSTATGKAFKFALNIIGDRLTYYKDPANNIPHGMPHIIHLTDGGLNDCGPGDPLWNQLADQISKLDGQGQLEANKKVIIVNYLSPSSTQADTVTFNGKSYSGQDLLSRLTGSESVFALTNDLGNFDSLVKMITLLVSSISRNYRTDQAAAAAASTTKAAKRYDADKSTLPPGGTP